MCITISTFLSHNLRTIHNITKASRCLIYQFNPDYSGYVFIDTKIPNEDIKLPYEAALNVGCRVKIYKPNEFFIQDAYLKSHRFTCYKGPQSISICNDINSSEFSSCFRSLLTSLEVDAYINVPIFKAEDLWGLLSIYQDRPREWEYKYIEYALQMGYIMSTFINHQLALTLANTDSLTGLANRYKAEKYITSLIEESKTYSLIFSDIDKFKVINDTYGHYIGDEVLKYLGQVVNLFLEEGDLPARIGGDEYLIVVLGNNRAEDIAHRIRDYLLDNPFLHEDITIECKVSFGVLIKTQDVKLDYMLVDRLMYKAKSSGTVVSDTVKGDKQLSLSSDL